MPTAKQLEIAQQKNAWDFGNDILYQLCRDNFLHISDDEILTKVLFIGRIYAAAVERRKNKLDEINDFFYLSTVVPAFKKSKIDKELDALRSMKVREIESIKSALQVHYYLTNMLKQITLLNKRSFSSKYLHFHLPELFYIYDSRAVNALRKFSSRIPEDLKNILKFENIDLEYAKFYCKCFDLKRHIKSEVNITLTNRELDKLLINEANSLNKKKRKYKD